MKLLSLRLEGFMPYRDAQFLDFRDKSIFALVGATGSGKSALLDAITFAFFGKTPRWSEERPGKNLISQGEKKLTVQVEFQIKDVIYQISRVVKRGGSHDAQLFHQVDGEFKPRSTERLTQKGTTDALVALLGMDYGTFTRTLMLPQGQFDRLLKPKEPRERKDLLIQLAGLGVYDKLQDRLANKQRPIEDDLKRLEGQLQGFQDLDLAQLPVLQAELVLVQQQREDLHGQLTQSSQTVQQLQHGLELMQQLEATAVQLRSLALREESVQAMRDRLLRSAEVESQSGHLQHLDQLRKSLAQAQEHVRAGEAKLATAADDLNRSNESLEVARLRAADLPTLEQERAEMQRFQEIIRGYQELVAEQASLSLAPLQAQLQQLEQKLLKQREEQEQAQAKLQLCEQSLQELGESSQAAHWQSALDLRRTLDQAEKQRQQADQSCQQNRSQRELLEPQWTESEAQLHSLQTRHDRLQTAQAALRQELTAQVLREQLQADCPCPVCLQTVAQLPPASAAEQSQLHSLDDQLQQLARDLKEAQKHNENLRTQAAMLLAQQPLLEGQLAEAGRRAQEARDEFAKRYEQLLEKSQLEARLARAVKDDKERTRLSKERQTLSQRQSELDTALQVDQSRQNNLSVQLEEQKQRLQTLDERVQARKEQLKQELGLSENFAETAQHRLEVATAALQQIQQELKDAEQRQRECQSQHDQLLSGLQVHRQQASEVSVQVQQREGQLARFLQQARLADEQSLRQLLLTPEEARTLREQVEQHGQQLHTAQEREQQLKDQLQNRRPSPADLSKAQENEKGLRLRQEECHKRHGAIEEQIRQLQHDLEQQAELRGQMARVEHQLKLHKKLAQMLTANGLKAFVANRLLHEILRLASAELERLSGRYQLQLEDGDILVVDNWNAGETRDVRSLSGGETFLASLTLALAMVDYLSQGSPLESLFIDEGFGTLDPETLEAVTLTLESLHEKGRLVGVITHVQELAERLPMQVRVEKGQGSSRIIDGISINVL